MAVLIDIETVKMRAIPRLMQILRVLIRHKFLGALFGRGHWPAPQEVRETLEELGVVFLKFGQVLAMRRDLLPAAYTRELEQLHDQLPAMAFGAVRAKVEAELGAPLTALFSSFNETPIGSATIAQVHEATLSRRPARGREGAAAWPASEDRHRHGGPQLPGRNWTKAVSPAAPTRPPNRGA